MEEGAPDLGLDLREYEDVTLEQITLKKQGSRIQGGGTRTPQKFEKNGTFEKRVPATIAKNDEGGNIQTTPSDINNWEQIELIEDLADKNESFQEYDGVKPHTDDGNMIDESPQTVDIGGITEASLVGQNNGRKLLEILK